MLAKKYRLPIQMVMSKKGVSKKTPFFIIKIFPNQLAHARIGVVISKKVAGKAVFRNTLRRIIFSTVESFFKQLPHQKDFLIIANTRINELKKEEIRMHLWEIFGRLE